MGRGNKKNWTPRSNNSISPRNEPSYYGSRTNPLPKLNDIQFGNQNMPRWQSGGFSENFDSQGGSQYSQSNELNYRGMMGSPGGSMQQTMTGAFPSFEGSTQTFGEPFHSPPAPNLSFSRPTHAGTMDQVHYSNLPSNRPYPNIWNEASCYNAGPSNDYTGRSNMQQRDSGKNDLYEQTDEHFSSKFKQNRNKPPILGRSNVQQPNSGRNDLYEQTDEHFSSKFKQNRNKPPILGRSNVQQPNSGRNDLYKRTDEHFSSKFEQNRNKPPILGRSNVQQPNSGRNDLYKRTDEHFSSKFEQNRNKPPILGKSNVQQPNSGRNDLYKRTDEHFSSKFEQNRNKPPILGSAPTESSNQSFKYETQEMHPKPSSYDRFETQGMDPKSSSYDRFEMQGMDPKPSSYDKYDTQVMHPKPSSYDKYETQNMHPKPSSYDKFEMQRMHPKPSSFDSRPFKGPSHIGKTDQSKNVNHKSSQNDFSSNKKRKFEPEVRKKNDRDCRSPDNFKPYMGYNDMEAKYTEKPFNPNFNKFLNDYSQQDQYSRPEFKSENRMESNYDNNKQYLARESFAQDPLLPRRSRSPHPNDYKILHRSEKREENKQDSYPFGNRFNLDSNIEQEIPEIPVSSSSQPWGTNDTEADTDEGDLRYELLRLKQQKIEEQLEELDRRSKETDQKLSMLENMPKAAYFPDF